MRPVYKIFAAIAMVIVFLSMATAIGFYKDMAKQNAIGRDEAIRIANQKEQETEIYRNKLGDTVRITKASELDLENFKALAKTKELVWLNKFENLNKKYKNLEAAGTIGFELETGTIVPDHVAVPCDSLGFIKAFSYKLKDEWNDIEALVIDTPKLSIRDKLYWVMEWQRPHRFIFKNWRFGPKEWKQEITNSNHLINIDSQSVFVIRRKD